MSRPPFSPDGSAIDRVEGGELSLAPLAPAEAQWLAAAFATIDPWVSYPYPAAALATFLEHQEPGAPRFAIRVGTETAGALALRLNWLRGPYIHLLGIIPAFQGRMIGRKTLAWIEREALAACERNLWIAASDFNSGALKLYENLGFARVAVLDGLVRDDRNEVLLRKRLAGD